MAHLGRRGYSGAVVLPEFRDGVFAETAPGVFGSGESPVPHMRVVSYDVLHWETTGIECSTVVLFWMPFCIGAEDDPASLPGFTTRAEVSRKLARIVLGIPPGDPRGWPPAGTFVTSPVGCTAAKTTP